MKEVKEERFAGPFCKPPFKHFIQSPVGLVPKAGGKTRLIFHLSYNFSKAWCDQSVNFFIPKHKCSVKYHDLDSAVNACLELSQVGQQKGKKGTIYIGKSDGLSAFHQVLLNKGSWPWLMICAEDPTDGKMKYLVDKCLPFGSSISCAIYQRVSDAVKHLTCHKITVTCIINYLDDFLLMHYRLEFCKDLMRDFLHVCGEINLPIAMDKTEWPETRMVFLGNLLDGEQLIVVIPLEKKLKAMNMINEFTGRKKTTVKKLQVLTGYLNFLTKAIFAGRAFTRRIYAKYTAMKDEKLKQYHHISLD